MISRDKDIWSAYIKAKRKFVERISSDIPIALGSGKLYGNILTLEIDQRKDDKQLESLIKSSFQIDANNLNLNEGYFLVPSSKIPSLEKLESFKKESERYYVNFITKPALEGEFCLTFSPTNELKGKLKKQGVDLKLDKDYKSEFTLEEIKQIIDPTLASLSSGIKREQEIGCILPFQPVGLFKRIESFIFSKDKGKTFKASTLSNSELKLESSEFTTNFYKRLEAFFRIELSQVELEFRFNKKALVDEDLQATIKNLKI